MTVTRSPQPGQAPFDLGRFGYVAGRKDSDAGTPVPGAGKHSLFLDIGEERGHRVEVLGEEGIELVIVALGATQRGAQPDSRDIADSVRSVLCQILLGLGAALVGHAAEAVVAARHQLPGCRIGKQVARELLAGHDIERLVFVERPDDILAERIHVDGHVPVVADRVGVADEVQPVDSHALAVVRGTEERIHQCHVSVGPPVADETLDHIRARRQAGEIEAETTGQRVAIRLTDRF